jgi:hypothetical protein
MPMNIFNDTSSRISIYPDSIRLTVQKPEGSGRKQDKQSTMGLHFLAAQQILDGKIIL